MAEGGLATVYVEFTVYLKILVVNCISERFTHIEQPGCYAVPSAQLFKGVWLIFLWINNQQVSLL